MCKLCQGKRASWEKPPKPSAPDPKDYSDPQAYAAMLDAYNARQKGEL